MDLSPTDAYQVRAAVGWLELSNSDEALAELDQLSSEGQAHPDVLEIRWLVLSQRKNWDEAVVVGAKLIIAAPERVSSWLHHSYALRRATDGGLLAAYESLSSVVEKFPEESTIPYNLACYTCQMDHDEEETLAWLQRAMESGERKAVLAMALKDPDLEPLRAEIARLAKSD
jgi:hypothetical protein